MHAIWITLTCFGATFAFGFLLAGVLGFADLDQLDKPCERGKQFSRLFDAIVLGGIGFLLSGLASNWTKRPEERRMVYAGLASLAAAVVFGYLVICTR
jgi:hypothetical protein